MIFGTDESMPSANRPASTMTADPSAFRPSRIRLERLGYPWSFPIGWSHRGVVIQEGEHGEVV